MVWLDYADFILISVYWNPLAYAVHVSVLISVYWFQYQYNEVNQYEISVVYPHHKPHELKDRLYPFCPNDTSYMVDLVHLLCRCSFTCQRQSPKSKRYQGKNNSVWVWCLQRFWHAYCQAPVPSPVFIDLIPMPNPKQSKSKVKPDQGQNTSPFFDLLVLKILLLSWIKPNQKQKTFPWAWHCWTPC